MTTKTLTITEFLTARLTEDLVTATMRGWHTSDCDTIPNESGYSYPCDCGVPERMKREVEAKRRIVERATAAHAAADLWTHERLKTDTRSPLPEWTRRDVFDEVLRDMASVYADHPDHQQEWRP